MFPHVWNFLISHYVAISQAAWCLRGLRFSAVRRSYFRFLYLALAALKIGKRARRLGWSKNMSMWSIMKYDTSRYGMSYEVTWVRYKILRMLRFRPQKLEVILGLNLKHFTNLKCQVILEEFPKHTTTIPCLSKDEDQDHTNLDDSQHTKGQSKIWAT